MKYAREFVSLEEEKMKNDFARQLFKAAEAATESKEAKTQLKKYGKIFFLGEDMKEISRLLDEMKDKLCNGTFLGERSREMANQMLKCYGWSLDGSLEELCIVPLQDRNN